MCFLTSLFTVDTGYAEDRINVVVDIHVLFIASSFSIHVRDGKHVIVGVRDVLMPRTVYL